MKFWRREVLAAALLCGCALLAGNAAAAPPANPPMRGLFKGHTARPLRYFPDGADFVITNGAEFFNRPLYCVNTGCRVDGGDKPEFSLYLPGRGGNLRFGIRTPGGVKWLNAAAQIVARYRPGSLIYDIRDPLLGTGGLRLTVLPLAASKGLIARAELRSDGDAAASAEMVWAFGGANGMRGKRGGDIGCEREPVGELFQLRPEQCAGNRFSIDGNRFTLRSKSAAIAGLCSPGSTLSVGDANQWDNPGALLESGGAAPKLPVLVGRAPLASNQPFYLALEVEDSIKPGGADLPVGSGKPGGADRPVSPSPAGGADLPVGSDARHSVPAGRDPARGMFQKNPALLTKFFQQAEQRRRAIAERVVVRTPDPFVNAAVPALCVAADAIWSARQQSFMHGAVAWRVRLLGWRGAYAGDELGWPQRTARHFAGFAREQNTNPIPATLPPADAGANLSRNEAALHSNGDLTRSHYDMNLVGVDVFFRHLLWTGDLDSARRFWPVVERHLAWERRLFRRPFGPDALPLYEGYADIWSSDDLEYEGGGSAQASAYNYFQNEMAARVAALLGKNPAPYRREAKLISEAMRRELWLPRRGWFAEWKDWLGLRRVHPSAAVWTFYTTVDSEVPTPMEAWQMSRFVDTQIAHIPIQGADFNPLASEQNSLASLHGNGGADLPVGQDAQQRVPTATRSRAAGCFVLPTTRWMPYTWSLNNVVMAECVHTALGYWQANRPEMAFRLFKGTLLDHMFMGLCPGNVGMTSFFDAARGEAQRDFADGIGATSRALVEGLFGVRPDALAGELLVRPGFPAGWNHASIRHPDFTFKFRRRGLEETYAVESRFPKPMSLRLQIAALRDGIRSVTVNGRPARWRVLQNSVGVPRVEIRCPPAPEQVVVIVWKGAAPSPRPATAVAASGGELRATLGPARVRRLADPQRALSGVKIRGDTVVGTATGVLGQRAVFAQVRQGQLRWWQPICFDIRPAWEIVGAANQDAAHLRFRLRNNTARAIVGRAIVRAGASRTDVRLRVPPFGESAPVVLSGGGLLPGTVPVTVELGGGEIVRGTVTDWKLAAPRRTQFERLNLAPMFNARVTQIFRNKYLAPRSPFCSLAIPEQGVGSWCHPKATFDVDDSGLRATAARNGGVFTLPDGVPFATPGAIDAKNIVFTSQWTNYPQEISIPLGGRTAAHLYLLMAGSTNPMQSRFDNGEVVVTYADGSTARLPLRNPENWWPIDQDYFMDDYAFRRPEPIPPRVDLETGRVRVLEPAQFEGRGGPVPGGAATVLDLPLNPDKPLKSLSVRALANEVVIGLMAATLTN